MWDEAEAAFDELVRARPYNASSWIERSRFHIARGRFHIARGQPERAVADFTRAIRIQPKNLGLRYCQALSLLAQGDQAGLRQACSDLLGRFGATADPQTANSVAWSCILGPDSVADRERPSAWPSSR